MSRSSKYQEDDPQWNAQTMGNRKYKEDSPAIANLKRRGEYRSPEVPHGSTKGRMGKMDLGPAIQRRMVVSTKEGPARKKAIAGIVKDFRKNPGRKHSNGNIDLSGKQ